jgi:hypothetical protein
MREDQDVKDVKDVKNDTCLKCKCALIRVFHVPNKCVLEQESTFLLQPLRPFHASLQVLEEKSRTADYCTFCCCACPVGSKKECHRQKLIPLFCLWKEFQHDDGDEE